jgi:hypothetical protein
LCFCGWVPAIPPPKRPRRKWLEGDIGGSPTHQAPEVVYYDPKAVELPKGAFPFRPKTFFVNVDKAKADLGFKPKFALAGDLPWYETHAMHK